MPSLSQIALSVADLERSLDWYERVLGMRRSGSTRLFRGPVMERITGIPDPLSRCAWMVDSQYRFQLELFAFERPTPRRHSDRGPDDIGYSAITVSVPDLDRAVDAAGGGPGSLATSDPHRAATVVDPDGNTLLLTEADPREPGRTRPRNGTAPCAVRGIRATVPDVGRSRRFFGDAMGLREALDDALGGSAPADRAAYWADDILVELVAHPAAAWPRGYRLCDIGVLNVAFATVSGKAHRDLCRRLARAGYRLTSRPARLGLGSVVYVTDDQGFSVELVHLTGFAARRLGYLE